MERMVQAVEEKRCWVPRLCLFLDDLGVGFYRWHVFLLRMSCLFCPFISSGAWMVRWYGLMCIFSSRDVFENLSCCFLL
jgi:hypothetical protein